jgi:hypothetical protein
MIRVMRGLSYLSISASSAESRTLPRRATLQTGSRRQGCAFARYINFLFLNFCIYFSCLAQVVATYMKWSAIVMVASYVTGGGTAFAAPSEIQDIDPELIISQVETVVTAQSLGYQTQSISGTLSVRKTLLSAQTGRSSIAFVDELIERDIYGSLNALRTTWAVGDELIIRLDPGVSLSSKLGPFGLVLRQSLGDNTYVVALTSVSSATGSTIIR